MNGLTNTIVSTGESTLSDTTIVATTTMTTTTDILTGATNTTTSTSYSVRLPDGSTGHDVSLTFTWPDGKTSTVNLSTTLSANQDIKSMLDWPITEDVNMTLNYKDASGNEYSEDLGKAGQEVEIKDGTIEPPANPVAAVIDFLADPIEAIASFIEEILVELFLPIGDGIVYFVSRSVGELVTTDSLIFNKVDKVNVNYWQKGTASSVKSVMQSVVNRWYGVFFKIAIMVYMMVLVVAGIQILLHSTAEKKAQYKEYLVSWIIGVAILCLFPYAMKYIVLLNETAVTAVSGKVTVSTNTKPAILENPSRAWEVLGDPEFVTEMTGDSNDTTDSMFFVRAKAQQNTKFILVVIYFILIGQMLVILLMYYKRAFMIAFLVTIFPLVAMTYAIDKMGDKKAQSFSIWFKEFVVNIVVQLFHAVVYVIVVNTTIQTFISTGGKNWLFMLICILFLFQGEKILRSIFSVKSSANTIGDLAATAATYTAMTKFFGNGKASNNIGSAQDNADNAAIKARSQARSSWNVGAARTVEAINASGDSVSSPSPSMQGSDDAGQFRGNDPAGVVTNEYDGAAALDQVSQGAMKHRLKNGFASALVKKGIGATGAAIGATYGMSKGDAGGNMAKNTLEGSHLGSKVAKGALDPAASLVNQLERDLDGAALASKIKRGEMDRTLNIDAIDSVTYVQPADVNPDEVADRHGEDMQKIYREALAAAAKAGSRGGRGKAEAAYWSYIKKNTKE